MEEDTHYDWQNCIYFEHLDSEFYYPEDESTTPSTEDKNSSASAPKKNMTEASVSRSQQVLVDASVRFASVSTDDVSALVGQQKNKNLRSSQTEQNFSID